MTSSCRYFAPFSPKPNEGLKIGNCITKCSLAPDSFMLTFSMRPPVSLDFDVAVNVSSNFFVQVTPVFGFDK